MSVNYVVACWSGLRRINPAPYPWDRTVFLKHHLKSIETLKHSLDQVTFVVADNPEEPKDYKDFINNLPKKIGSAAVAVMRRPNIGYSYGAYNHVFKLYGKSFDYYLLMEDDYVFLRDDFDKDLLTAIDRDPKCGFVSFVLEKGTKKAMAVRAANEASGGKGIAAAFEKYCPDKFVWPRVAVGLARSSALQAIWDKFGELPHAKGTNHTECKFLGQFSLGIVFQKVGWNVGDMLPDVRVEAFGPQGQMLKYGPMDKPLVLSSIQFRLKDSKALFATS